ncbi:MAG: GWxTD domain-containing protein [bacterium]|nr:MAG: GWxTD domain-containing protein [bacterium]
MILNRIKISILLIIIFSIMINSAPGQMRPERSPFNQSRQMFGPPLFLYDTYYFLSQSDANNGFSYRLDVYVAFANDILQFIKERQGNFTAGYDLYLSILDHKGNHVAEKLTGNQISVQTFEQTNDRELNNKHHLSFDLIPGQYKLILDLTDYDTQKSLHREKEINIESIDLDRVSVSEILFADKVFFDSLKNIQEIIPNLNRNFIEPKSNFWAYFEIYPVSTSSSIKFTYTITDASEQAIIRNEQQTTVDKKIMPYLLDLSKDIKTPGRYTLLIQLEQKAEKASTKAKFSANWSNFEFSTLNVNIAIEALKEFIPDKEYKYLEQASDSAKEAWFKNFWAERDPTPDTKENELQKEFYQRIDFANNHFMVNPLDKEGWKTDRGNIYIKYGPPTDVERHQDQLNLPPYEIWYYEKLDRRFFFEDKSGVGDFQLVRIE